MQRLVRMTETDIHVTSDHVLQDVYRALVENI